MLRCQLWSATEKRNGKGRRKSKSKKKKKDEKPPPIEIRERLFAARTAVPTSVCSG